MGIALVQLVQGMDDAVIEGGYNLQLSVVSCL